MQSVVIVRVIFISAFLFYCLLLNHSFPTNPNKITYCFQLILSLFTTLQNYILWKCVRLFLIFETAALESSRLNKKKSNEEEPMDPMGKLSRSTFVDVLYRTASSGQLTDMWTSLSRNTFVQITHLFDSSNSGVVLW